MRITKLTRQQSNIATVTLVGMALALAATAVSAGTTGTEFQQLHTTLTGWTEGFLGKALAIAAFLFGAGMGVAKQTVVPAILGVVFALVFTVGPNIINTMMTAVI
jgi:conjugal transfer pilus assembly protein TraA